MSDPGNYLNNPIILAVHVVSKVALSIFVCISPSLLRKPFLYKFGSHEKIGSIFARQFLEKSDTVLLCAVSQIIIIPIWVVEKRPLSIVQCKFKRSNKSRIGFQAV